MIKQKLLLALFFTIILTSVEAQNDVNQYDESGKRHGLWTKNYEGTDILRYTGQFNHGKEIDTFKYYKVKNKKAVLSAIKVFNSQNNLAKVTFFASNGKKVSEGEMDGKKFIGKWVYYHNNSNKILIEEFYNPKGLLDGERLVYYLNGNIAEKALYKQGKLDGPSFWFTEKKDTLRMSTYSDDKLNGLSIYNDASGKLSAKGNYKDNLKVGAWLYYKDGELEKEVDHSN